MVGKGNEKTAAEKPLKASDLIVAFKGMTWTPTLNPMLPIGVQKPVENEPLTVYAIRILVDPKKRPDIVPRGTLFTQVNFKGQHDVLHPPDDEAMKKAARAKIEESWPDVVFP
jgi:hypothetical protein